MISEEEAESIKQKLIQHISETFPEERKQEAISQIEAMNSDQLESFLEKNKLIKNAEGGTEGEQCVFCSIVSEKIKSVKIAENRNAIAVLDINPISKGHVMIIPKKHGETDKGIMKFAENLAKKIQKKFSAKNAEFQKTKLFGHETISVLPVYGNETFTSEKQRSSIEELEKIKQEFSTKKPRKEKTTNIQKIKERLWLPKRIP